MVKLFLLGPCSVGHELWTEVIYVTSRPEQLTATEGASTVSLLSWYWPQKGRRPLHQTEEQWWADTQWASAMRQKWTIAVESWGFGAVIQQSIICPVLVSLEWNQADRHRVGWPIKRPKRNDKGPDSILFNKLYHELLNSDFDCIYI